MRKTIENGVELSDKDEIVATGKTETIRRTIRVRKYRLFLPEVVAGMAYTFIQYNKYGTVTDPSGQMVVALAGHDYVKNIKFSAMINFNMFIPNFDFNPFWQFGIGANADIPTFMTGVGLRDILGTHRLSVSGGAAFAWTKELSTLKPGDKVSGTADLEKDRTY